MGVVVAAVGVALVLLSVLLVDDGAGVTTSDPVTFSGRNPIGSSSTTAV